MTYIQLIVTVVVAVFTCNGLWEIVKYKIERKDSTKSAEDEALIALLHDRIYQLAECYILSGFITFEEFDNLTYLYSPYKKLGGNNTGEDLYQKCKSLPRVKEGNRKGD